MSNYSDPYEQMGISTESLADANDTDADAGMENEPTTTFGSSGSGCPSCSGMESWEDTRNSVLLSERSSMHNGDLGMVLQIQAKRPAIHILTQDNSEFRVYMRSDIWVSPREVNQLCRFLDTRTEHQVVKFLLGVDMSTEQSSLIGPILSAIESCPARTVGLAMGLCSLPETMMWLSCKERDVERYGGINFSKPAFLKTVKEYDYYYRLAFAKAIEIGLLTEADVTSVFENNTEVTIMYNEYHERVQHEH